MDSQNGDKRMKVAHSSHELLDGVDIVRVISRYAGLKKAGANFKAHCPFHSDKTTSFVVSSQRQVFKCFGCQKGGNAIKFIMLIEGLDRHEACGKLAEMFNIKYEPGNR